MSENLLHGRAKVAPILRIFNISQARKDSFFPLSVGYPYRRGKDVREGSLVPSLRKERYNLGQTPLLDIIWLPVMHFSEIVRTILFGSPRRSVAVSTSAEQDQYVNAILTKYLPPAPNPQIKQKLEPFVKKWAGPYFLSMNYSGSMAKLTPVRGESGVDFFISLQTTMPLQDVYEGLFNLLSSFNLKPQKRNVSIHINYLGTEVDLTPGRLQLGGSVDAPRRFSLPYSRVYVKARYTNSVYVKARYTKKEMTS